MSAAPPTLVRRLLAAFGAGLALPPAFALPTAGLLLLTPLAEARAEAPPEQALDAAIAAVRAEIEAARADAGASGALMRELESTRARLNEATAELAASRGRLRALEAERASGAEVAEAVADVRRERDEAVRRNADLVAQLDQAETLMTEARNAVLPVRGEAARLAAERDEARREAATLAEESRGLRDRVARLERAAAASTGEIRDVGGQLVQALTRSRDLTRALAQVQSERDALDRALEAGGPGRAAGPVAAFPAGGVALASETPADDPGAGDSGAEDWAPEEPTPVGVEDAAAAKIGSIADLELPDYGAGGYADEAGGLDPEAPATAVAAVYPLPADAPGLRTSVTREGRVTLVPEDLDFVEGGVELAPGAEAGLGAVAALLRRYPGQRVLVRGHTDSVGEARDNIALSRDRAERIRAVLMATFGLDGGLIATDGLGETEPVASNLTAAGRRANRRVEIVIGG